jgi:hypothetical protein
MPAPLLCVGCMPVFAKQLTSSHADRMSYVASVLQREGAVHVDQRQGVTKLILMCAASILAHSCVQHKYCSAHILQEGPCVQYVTGLICRISRRRQVLPHI